MGWIYKTVRAAGRVFFHTYLGYDVYHPERVPTEGPAILAANHASYIDPVVIGSGLERLIYYLARESAFTFPLGYIMRGCNAIPVDREGGGVRGMMQIMDRLRQGNGIVLFPEGTRSPDGNFQKARAGIGLIVIKSTAPVIPVRILGTYEAWNRTMLLPRPRRRIAVIYGEPLPFTELRREAAECPKERLKAIYQQVADEIMTAIAALEKK